jgi:TonB family protein
MREIFLRAMGGLALTAHLFGQDMPNPKTLTIPEYKPTPSYFCSPVNVLRRLEPEYTLEAREARRQGTVVLYIEVGPWGLAEKIQIIRGLGLGLDEKAVEAVQQWVFKPVKIYGPEEVVTTLISVDFRLPEALESSDDDLLFASSDPGIRAPRIVSRIEPAYSEQARKAGLQGIIVVYTEVTPEGRLQNIQVLQGLGMGMDEQAAERIRQWKFEPATRDGKPIRVMMPVEINFSLRER